MCNLTTQTMAFTFADTNDDKDSVKESHGTFQFISAVCIEPSPPPLNQQQTKATPFFSLNSLFSGIISKSLSHSASPPGFWCHFQCNTWLMTDICFTCTLQEKKRSTQCTEPFLFFDNTSDFTLTCFVKTIPTEIKRHITKVKLET